MKYAFCIALLLTLAHASDFAPSRAFLEKNCFECHDTDTAKGGLDLTTLKFDPSDTKLFAKWVLVHDRLRDGEMPPKKRTKPAAPIAPAEIDVFLKSLAEPLASADRNREASEGRSTWRRLNRYEYENSVRDLLQAPWLQIKQTLPEDGESQRFNKIGDALDVSHVQMSRYLSAADYALREVLSQGEPPGAKVTRYYARDQRSFAGKMKFNVFNTRPERATFPVLGTQGQPDVRSGKAPSTAGAADPATREREAIGVVASAYEPIEPRFENFEAQQPGHYKIRLSAYSVWAGPGKDPNKFFIPDLDNVSKGRRDEPICMYAEMRPHLLRWLGRFDVTPEPSVHQLDVWLLKGESIRPDAARLFRSRPPAWHNPLAEKDGQPAVAFQWLEVEGPIVEEWPTASQKILFGDLPLEKKDNVETIAPPEPRPEPKAAPEFKGDVKPTADAKPAEPAKPADPPRMRRGEPKIIHHISIEAKSSNPGADASRLLRNFMERAYRRPVQDADHQRFLGVIQSAMKSGSNFTEAMIAGYSAVLCSPEFVCLEEKPGKLDDFALAARLSYFLWNSPPDEALRALAAKNEIHRPEVLRAQTERLLNDSRSQRFVDAFLDYWLDLRKLDATAPDANLYPDYYLDDLLVESAQSETQMFFAELLAKNLPARSIVSSDFAMLNERLAVHYGIANVKGVELRRVTLPKDSVRGGLMTQASVLKVTANGTTTSPVIRGAWIMERILGKPPPPPPPSVPAVEPDIRGATTIREQLEKHRTLPTCNACHAKIDPAGFALENFDVLGGWRDNYRAMGEGKHVQGFGKNGQPFAFHLGPAVDASGELPGGGKFKDIRELKQLLLKDEKQLARNLTRQLAVYATGAAIRFGDRERIEKILENSAKDDYGVRTIIQELVQSDLFQTK